jgi:hypothetical protein
MNKKDYKDFEAAILKQRKEVSSSKKAAKKLLTELGIFHLLVPKGANKLSSASSH